jgi:hypothetical protein
MRLNPTTNLIISKEEDGQASKAIDGDQQTLALQSVNDVALRYTVHDGEISSKVLEEQREGQRGQERHGCV